MKTLLVLRHAKAERDSPTGADFDRPLADRGWSDAELVGREMRARGILADCVVASPAKRTVETVAALAGGYGPIEPRFDERIYDASPGVLAELVRQSDDSCDSLLLVGHNPGLEALILRVAMDEPNPHCERIAEGFPTSGLAVLELPVDHWRDADGGIARVVALITAKDLR